MLLNDQVVPTTKDQGATNEPISKVITIDMACQYHIVLVTKYRYKVLQGAVAVEVENCIRAFSEQKQCEVVGLKVQITEGQGKQSPFQGQPKPGSLGQDIYI
ncbi:MAG: transposase [Desulfotignum sp.]